MIEEQDFYWTLLDTLKDGVYFADGNRKITYWNKGAEGLTGYKATEVLGKSCGDNILVHIDEVGTELCKGNCPLAQVLKSGKPCETRIYLHHKKGHRVPVEVRVNPVTGKDGKIIGAVEIFSDSSGKDLLAQRLQDLAGDGLLDDITSLPNRRYLEMKLESRLEEFKKYEQPLGVLYFHVTLPESEKKNGKKMGTQPGLDQVLKILAQTFSGIFNPFDIVGRWDKNEFIGIFPGVNWEKLSKAGDIYRVLLNASDFSSAGVVPLISIGSALGQADDDPAKLVARAKERAQ